MVEQILIRLEQDASAADWWVLDTQGHRRGGIGHAPLNEIARHTPSRRVVVAIPSREITLTRLRLPMRSRRQWAEAIPFALEEQVAGDLDTLHFASGNPDQNGNIPVAIVERACLEKWLAILFEAGLHPDELWPDLFLLPASPSAWNIARSTDLLIRGPGLPGCAVADRLAPEILKRILRDLPEVARPREIAFWGEPTDPAVPILEPMATQLGCSFRFSDGFWYEEASRAPIQGLNRLQGAFAPGHQRQARWARWKPVARLGSVVLAVALALLIIQRIRLASTAQAWQTRVHQIFHRVLPGQPYVSPRAQIEQALRLRSAGPAGTLRFLHLLVRMSKNRPTTIHLLTLSYRARAIGLQFTAPSLTAARDFEQSIVRRAHWLRQHQKVEKDPGGIRIQVVYRARGPSS